MVIFAFCHQFLMPYVDSERSRAGVSPKWRLKRLISAKSSSKSPLLKRFPTSFRLLAQAFIVLGTRFGSFERLKMKPAAMFSHENEKSALSISDLESSRLARQGPPAQSRSALHACLPVRELRLFVTDKCFQSS
jgi:hypothetical protein